MNYHQTVPYQLLDYLWFFFIYSFLGWCMEVIYAAIRTKKLINRGFLNGPVCPIYGVGMLIVLLALSPLVLDLYTLKAAHLSLLENLKEIGLSLFILFIVSMGLTTLLEFLTGWVLEKFFHATWWDYHHQKWNLKGYICLKFSLLWGVACVVILYLIHPTLYRILNHLHRRGNSFFSHLPLFKMPYLVEWLILALFATIFIIDGIITIIHLLKWQNHIKLLISIENRLHSTSNKMGEKLYEITMKLIQIKEKETFMAEIQHIKERGELDWAEWTLKYRELKEKPLAGFLRITQAFPALKIPRLNHEEMLKNHLKRKEFKKKQPK